MTTGCTQIFVERTTDCLYMTAPPSAYGTILEYAANVQRYNATNRG